MPEDDHFALVRRQEFQHLAHAVMALALHHLAVRAVLAEIQDLENIVVLAVPDRGGALDLAEMVHAKVVRDAHGPGKEFAFFRVTSATDGVDDPDENVLKNVFGKELVLDKQENRGEDLVFVTVDQYFEGR